MGIGDWWRFESFVGMSPLLLEYPFNIRVHPIDLE
jgi:hypothetical protein